MKVLICIGCYTLEQALVILLTAHLLIIVVVATVFAVLLLHPLRARVVVHSPMMDWFRLGLLPLLLICKRLFQDLIVRR